MLTFLLTLKLICQLTWPTYANELRQSFEGEVISLPAGGQIWVENGQVLRAEPTGNILKLHLLKPGHSEVKVGNVEYRVSVLTRNQRRTLELLNAAVSKTLNLRVGVDHSYVAVTGQLARWQDWERLAQTCADNECEYEMRTTFSKQTELQIRQQLAEKLRANSIFQYRLEFTDHFQIHLHPNNLQHEKIRRLLARYGVATINDLTSLSLVPSVKVQVTIAEVKRSEFTKLGVEWPSSYNAKILGTENGGTNGLEISIQGLEQNGLGRVLASPNLLCKSGKEAEFWAGGEFPIKVISSKSHEVIWKKYGILMKLKPTADFSGRMSISIETEISSIDSDRSVEGVPALYTNKLESHFDLSKSKTIALSGLIKHEQGESQSGLPGLSRIPILGALFSSSDFRDNRTELVIFVKPEIVNEEGEL